MMQFVNCTIALFTPTPTPNTHFGAMLATFWELAEFRVAFNGNRGSATLIYGHKRKKRTRSRKPCARGG